MSTKKEYHLEAHLRQDVGKGASRRLRRENTIPGIVYGTDKEPMPVNLTHHIVAHALEDEAFYTRVLTLTINGKPEKVVLKDIQRHPYKPQILHMDFQRISETEKLSMLIPLHFVGEDVAPGVKIGGGIVSHLLSEVQVRCLPKDLPEFITVDVSKLELNQNLHLSQLPIPEGVEIVDLAHGEDKPIVSIHIPRVVEEAPKVEGAAAPAEGEAPKEGEAAAAGAAKAEGGEAAAKGGKEAAAKGGKDKK